MSYKWPPVLSYPVFLIINRKAVTNGRLKLEYEDILTPEIAVKNFPEHKVILDEIMAKGWKYLYIEARGKYFIELEFSGQALRIIPYTADWFMTGRFSIDIELGKPFPEIKIDELTEFRINISTVSFPRATTIDLVKKTITYIESTFWNWSDEWMNDKETLSKALEVYEVIKWLIEEKKFKLSENLSEERLKELLQKFNEYKTNSSAQN